MTRHCDIRTGDLRYQPKLLGFDPTRYTSAANAAPTSQRLTGAPPFMAIDLLDGFSDAYPLRFDLESLLWSSLWVAQCCHKGEVVHRALREHPVKMWLSGTNQDIGAHKFVLLMRPWKLRFQPEFEDIKKELRRFLLCFREEYTRVERQDDDDWTPETSERTPLITRVGLLAALE
ncbi:hypothetical protein FRB99_004948 [Tulasnella sp. 403]|nr:hypothetical protein FRB99_004948 [Tulasnella sp. 403]